MLKQKNFEVFPVRASIGLSKGIGNAALYSIIASDASEVIVFDTETTGLSSKCDKILEIAAVRIMCGEITSEFHTYANPGITISPDISRLTGITSEMVKDAPSQENAVRAYLDFAGGKPLCAHNAAFHLKFIGECCENMGVEFSPAYFDTLELSHALLPDLTDYKLQSVAEALKLPTVLCNNVPEGARVTALVMAALFVRLRKRGVTDADANANFSTSKLKTP